MARQEPVQEARRVGDWVLDAQSIGQGSFAVVWKAHHATTGAAAAVKEISLDKLNAKLRQSLESEVSILKRITHQNIVHLHEVLEVWALHAQRVASTWRRQLGGGAARKCGQLRCAVRSGVMNEFWSWRRGRQWQHCRPDQAGGGGSSVRSGSVGRGGGEWRGRRAALSVQPTPLPLLIVCAPPPTSAYPALSRSALSLVAVMVPCSIPSSLGRNGADLPPPDPPTPSLLSSACPTPSSASSSSSYGPGPALTPPPFFPTALVQERNKLYLVMEFCAGGDLAHYLRAHRRAPEAVARHFLRQLAAGLQEMWAHHLVHVRHRPTPPCYCCLCCRCCWPPRGVGTPSRPM